ITKFQSQFGEKGAFRLISSDEMNDPEVNPEEGLFSHTDDYIKLTEVARKYAEIHESKLNSKEHYQGLLEISKTDPEIIPLFVKTPDGNLRIIPSHSAEMQITEGSKLVYLGKQITKEINKEET
ncbi:cell shape-determining protein, partial [Tamlana crocina]|nr:cell shape-determining protein [Tamlana crocina]